MGNALVQCNQNLYKIDILIHSRPTFRAVHDDLLLLRRGRLAAAARLVGVLVLRDDLRQEVDVPDRQP